MKRNRIDKTVGKIVAFAGLFTTLAISPNLTLDPINVVKFLIVGIFGFASLFLIFDRKFKVNNFKNLEMIFPFMFVFFLCLSFLLSNAPKVQQLFGTYGRNTGLISYSALAIIFIASSLMKEEIELRFVAISFLITGSVVTLYCLIQAVGLDPITWNNRYNAVIGTLGNPNFAASFMGMFITFASALMFGNLRREFRILILILSLVAIFAIYKSQSYQGFATAFAGISVVCFIYLWSRTHRKLFLIPYLLVVSFLTTISIFGMLNMGPLSQFLYKDSVIFRGDYWRASKAMFLNHPLFGVGLDSYGDWYRRYRDLLSIQRRGTDVVTNSAHNVFLDILNTSGIFSFLIYLSLILITFNFVQKSIREFPTFDPVFTGYFGAWCAYIAQSLISINNLGLAIWGWILPGAIIANYKIKRKLVYKNVNHFRGLLAKIGFLIGFIICIFPFSADVKLRNSLQSGDVSTLMANVKSFPPNSLSLVYVSNVLSQNQRHKEALEIIRYSVAFNSRSFDSWFQLYNSPVSSKAEKAYALKNMQLLDPQNTDVGSIHK